MRRERLILLGSTALAVLALLAGGLLVLAYGFEPPRWLLISELTVCCGLALLCGFTACLPAFRRLLPWLTLRPVRGTVLVVSGIGAIYMPPQFIAAGVLLALGIKLVWAEACELAEAETQASGVSAPPAGGGLGNRHAEALEATEPVPQAELVAATVPEALPSPTGQRAVERWRPRPSALAREGKR